MRHTTVTTVSTGQAGGGSPVPHHQAAPTPTTASCCHWRLLSWCALWFGTWYVARQRLHQSTGCLPERFARRARACGLDFRQCWHSSRWHWMRPLRRESAQHVRRSRICGRRDFALRVAARYDRAGSRLTSATRGTSCIRRTGGHQFRHSGGSGFGNTGSGGAFKTTSPSFSPLQRSALRRWRAGMSGAPLRSMPAPRRMVRGASVGRVRRPG